RMSFQEWAACASRRANTVRTARRCRSAMRSTAPASPTVVSDCAARRPPAKDPSRVGLPGEVAYGGHALVASARVDSTPGFRGEPLINLANAVELGFVEFREIEQDVVRAGRNAQQFV